MKPMVCLKCGCSDIHRSKRRGAIEWILKRFLIVPWRCMRCQRRFFFHLRHTKLRESEQHFRSLLDEAPAMLLDEVPVMLWMSGTDARCAFFNKPWLDFTGLSQKEQLEQDWVARVHPEDRERCVNQYLVAFKSRENFTLEYWLMRKDGAYRWLLHNGVPRYSADGAFLGYIGYPRGLHRSQRR
jgi:PAS domain S-box-containing protein